MTYTRQTTRYVDVILSLTKSPKTTREIAADLGMNWYQALSDLLRQMHKLQMIHISSWKKTSQEHAIQAAVWGLGLDIDADPPVSKKGKILSNIKERIISSSTDLIAFCQIWRQLEIGNKSTKDLSDASGFTLDTVNILIKLLRKNNLVYISKYERQNHGGDPIRKFTAGYKMQDVARPAPLTKNVLNEKKRIMRRINKFNKTNPLTL